MSSTALPIPSWTGVVTHWTLNIPVLVVVLLLLGWYVRAVRRTPLHRLPDGLGPWPVRRWVSFGAGLVLFAWLGCGFFEVYRRAQFWVWTAQQLVLWLIVPLLLLAGGPLRLARDNALVFRVLRSRPCRILANPLVAPALVPVLSAVLFFGPVPAWAVRWDAVGWAIQLLLVAVGALMLLPLVGSEERVSSLAVGLSLAIGMFELVLDAIPGIALRLHKHTATSYFAYRTPQHWALSPVHDQQVAGAIVWCMAEIIDLPFLLLVFRRWIKADAREAADVDTVLEAERIARGTKHDEPANDEPWWLSDPRMRDRYPR